jgi:sensor histidine kinase regulating citrate/malate metabolism
MLYVADKRHGINKDIIVVVIIIIIIIILLDLAVSWRFVELYIKIVFGIRPSSIHRI